MDIKKQKMKRITFYEIEDAVDKATTGTTNNQINGLYYASDVTDARPLFVKYQEIYYDFLPENFGMDLFIADPKAKKTDLLSTIFLGTNGLFVSQKFQDFLNQYKVSHCNYLPVYIKNLGEDNENSFLNLIRCPLLDFEKSEFEVKHRKKPENNYPIQLKSHEEFLSENNKFSDYSIRIAVNKAVIKEEPDLFMYEINGRKLISERLKNAIEQSDLKGIWIEPFDVEFFIED